MIWSHHFISIIRVRYWPISFISWHPANHRCGSRQSVWECEEFLHKFPHSCLKKHLQKNKKWKWLLFIGRIFSNQGTSRFFLDFKEFFPDFHHIRKFGCVVAPPAPLLLHLCCKLPEVIESIFLVLAPVPKKWLQPVAVLRGDLGGPWPVPIFGWPPAWLPSFLLNFTFKFVWFIYAEDNFQLAKFWTII